MCFVRIVERTANIWLYLFNRLVFIKRRDMFTSRYDLNLNVIQINFRLWKFTVPSLRISVFTFFNLTFMWPCIVKVLFLSTTNRMQRYTMFFIIVKQANLACTRFCVYRFWAPDDGRRIRPKLVVLKKNIVHSNYILLKSYSSFHNTLASKVKDS
jgi:hypothetical protein